jgi:fructose-1,6-bisphosphatase/inositol monophosphatase family enzyme
METKKLNRILLEYLYQTVKAVRAMSKAGKGKEILGGIPGRPEDLELRVDRVGEEIIKKLLLENKVQAEIFSESENGSIKIGKGEAELYISMDPFDNTILYFTGFRHAWYTALTFYDKKRKPICVGIGDILDGKAWIFDGEETFLLDMATRAKRTVSPHSHKFLKGPISLASYLMSSQYSVKFLRHFGDMIKNMDAKALLYPFGGSHIYGYLADGRVDAYVMFDEPRSEIDPSFAIAKSVGCDIGEVDTKGNWEEYKFVPGKQYEKVDFFIAACTKELRNDIIRYYMEQKHL